MSCLWKGSFYTFNFWNVQGYTQRSTDSKMRMRDCNRNFLDELFILKLFSSTTQTITGIERHAIRALEFSIYIYRYKSIQLLLLLYRCSSRSRLLSLAFCSPW